MCKSMGDNCCICNMFIDNKGGRICAIKDLEGIDEHRADMIASTVEQWSIKHPEKTRADVFKEMFPNATGVEATCPSFVDGGECKDYTDEGYCTDACSKNYWTSPAPDGFGKGK